MRAVPLLALAVVVLGGGCSTRRMHALRRDCASGYGSSCGDVVARLTAAGRHEEAFEEARSALAMLHARCRDGDYDACDAYPRMEIARAVDAPGEVPTRSLALYDLLCEQYVDEACTELARASISGLVLPESREEAIRYAQLACEIRGETPCVAADQPRSLLADLTGASAQAYLQRELDRILEAHAAGRPEEGRARLLELLRDGPDPGYHSDSVPGSPNPEELAMRELWDEVAGLYWIDLVELPLQAGQQWLGTGRAISLARRAPALRTRAWDLRVALGEHHLALARDPARRMGSRNLHARIAMQLLSAHGSYNSENFRAELIRETRPDGANVPLAFVSSSSTCAIAVPPSSTDAFAEVVLDIRRCKWIEERKTVQEPVYQIRNVPPKIETTTGMVTGIVSLSGCGPDGAMSCYGTREVSRTKVLEPGYTEMVVVKYVETEIVDADIVIEGTAWVRGSEARPVELNHAVKQIRPLEPGRELEDPVPALAAMVERLARRELSAELLTRELEANLDEALRAAQTDDLERWEAALIGVLFSDNPVRGELLGRVARAHGLPAQVLDAALMNYPLPYGNSGTPMGFVEAE